MKYTALLASLLLAAGLVSHPAASQAATLVAEAADTQEAETQEAADTDTAATDTKAETQEADTEAKEAADTDTEAAATEKTEKPAAAAAKPVKPTAPNTTIQSKNSVEWIPLARINPAKPVTIVLNNQTQEELEYLITTHTNFRNLAAGQKATVIVTDFPAFLNINAKRSVGVKYLMRVKQNQIMLDLRLTAEQGDTTLNIHKQGAIYLY